MEFLAIARCANCDDYQNGEASFYLQSVYRGELVSRIIVECPRLGFFIEGKDYLLFAIGKIKRKKILYAKIIKARLLF